MKNVGKKMPTKAVREGYTPTSCYYKEKEDGQIKYIISGDNIRLITNLMRVIIEKMPQVVEVVLKKYAVTIDNIDSFEGFEWDFYYAETSREKVLKSLDEYQDFLFHDGSHQFIVKNPHTNTYIKYDEHGVLFAFMNDFLIEESLARYDIIPERTEMIWEKEHSHFQPKDSDDLFQCIVEYLNLKPE